MRQLTVGVDRSPEIDALRAEIAAHRREECRQIVREELAAGLEKLRQQGHPLLDADARTTLQDLYTVFQGEDGHGKSREELLKGLRAGIATWVEAKRDHVPQKQPTGLHRVRKLVDRRPEPILMIAISVGHSILLSLHGLVTRHGTGAISAASRWLQSMGWARRAAVPAAPRPSGATGGGA